MGTHLSFMAFGNSGMYIEKEKRNLNGKGDMFLCIRQRQWDDDGSSSSNK
jgi:hypothetical protein